MLPGRVAVAFIVALSGSAAGPAHAGTIQIVMDKVVYAPAEAAAKVGDTIEWINNDILDHTATASDGSWNVVIAAKETKRLMLKQPGTVEYYCKYHPNMTGRIVVAPE